MPGIDHPGLPGDELELGAAAAHTFAAAMREIAAIDGRHPDEDALIDEFERGLPGQALSRPDLSALDTPALRLAFLRSLVLVAFADGRMSEGERAALRDYGSRLGLSEGDLTQAITEVASYLLSSFKGVKVYRDQVVTIGLGLGLDEATIGRIVDAADRG